MTTIDIVLKNIKLLQQELLKMDSLIQDEIISIIIDGSVVRKDFLENSSDIDITITKSNNNIDLDIKKRVEETIREVESKLPIREFPRKPLIYDIQWQNLEIVRETGHREIQEWNSSNIPSGYPKLWLYAFDSIKYHNVIYGEDMTELYTKISPKYFVPIRIERIIKSVKNLQGNISYYELNKGGITQIKNAWEAIRCICIANGLESINKNDVYRFSKELFKEREELLTIEDLYGFYLNKENSKLMVGDFRSRLCNFTLEIIEKYY
ncbi:hypothetical protein GOQ29_05460 [Clostridium sp. D2Q-14]|uniref:nucleotidyltransferase domain-containing protein n=1 Tax=Anaeromonas gelatinilytica TaxID=2683194 RepID=UPI00193C8020|nr:nucleotidyltransferase domain-containing protein [Anaeromonas gelatinilytica]MBS4535066.1 hypothetical protein [Anaeromonas gelatinilytica]